MKIKGMESGWQFFEHAEAGDREAARSLLKSFCADVKGGQAPGPRMLDYLARAFQQVLVGKSADVALGLAQGRRGRPRNPKLGFPKTDKELRVLRYAQSVAELIDSGHKLSIAYDLVAAKYGVSTMRVRRAWRARRPMAECFAWIEKQQRQFDRMGMANAVRLAKKQILARFQRAGDKDAAGHHKMTPAAAWAAETSKKRVIEIILDETKPIDDQGTVIVTEAELKAAFMRGFRNARAREKRVVNRRQGSASPRKPRGSRR